MIATLKLQAAVDLLRNPLQDRARGIFTDLSGIMLADDSGAEPIECFDDPTACHYFLEWLDQRRQEREARRQLAIKRSSFKLVAGGTL